MPERPERDLPPRIYEEESTVISSHRCPDEEEATVLSESSAHTQHIQADEDKTTAITGAPVAQAAQPPRVRLLYIGNNPLLPVGHCIDIPGSSQAFVIGRHNKQARVSECDFEFGTHVQNISRKHASFLYRDNLPCVCDLRSVNGTFLNGIRLEANRYYYIKSGDILAFSSKGIEYRVSVLEA